MRLAAQLLFITVVCAVAYYVFSHPNLEKLDRLEEELGQLAAQNQELARQNDALEQQILALREDPRLVERRARETAGLARPEELIFQFEKPDEVVRLRVRLKVEPEGLELAGRPVAPGQLAQALSELREEMPQATLTVIFSEDLGPIERQRVADIVERSPMGPLHLAP